MTRDLFYRCYAARSCASEAEIRRDMVALPCWCGIEGCNGWQMVMRDGTCHRELWRTEPDLARLYPEDAPKQVR